MKNHLTTASLNVWRLISFKSSWHMGLRETPTQTEPGRPGRMFVLYFCRQKVPNKRWRGAAAEQQQSRWQRRRSQADNVLPRLPQGPRLRRSVLVWVGSRPGLLGSAVSRCRPSVLSCLSAALDQCAGPDTDTSAAPAEPLVCTVQWQLDVRGH